MPGPYTITVGAGGSAAVHSPATQATNGSDSVFSTISNELSSGGEVRLVGFGTFVVTNRAATTGRNPRTGESIQIPASKQPKFRAGKSLKSSVNS